MSLILETAHALYFSTYDIAKQDLEGNIGRGHHSFATDTTVLNVRADLASARAYAAVIRQLQVKLSLILSMVYLLLLKAYRSDQTTNASPWGSLPFSL